MVPGKISIQTDVVMRASEPPRDKLP